MSDSNKQAFNADKTDNATKTDKSVKKQMPLHLEVKEFFDRLHVQFITLVLDASQHVDLNDCPAEALTHVVSMMQCQLVELPKVKEALDLYGNPKAWGAKKVRGPLGSQLLNIAHKVHGERSTDIMAIRKLRLVKERL